MLTLGKQEVTKSKSKIFVCETCDYSTSQKANYEKHLLTAKHRRVTLVTNCNHACPCGKSFTCRQHLYRHKKLCEVANCSAAKVAKVAKNQNVIIVTFVIINAIKNLIGINILTP